MASFTLHIVLSVQKLCVLCYETVVYGAKILSFYNVGHKVVHPVLECIWFNLCSVFSVKTTDFIASQKMDSWITYFERRLPQSIKSV